MRLIRPNFLDEVLIDEVVAERQNGVNKTYFNGIKEKWKERIAEYVKYGGNPEKILTWSEIVDVKTKTRFLTLYNSPKDNSAQLPILRKLRERTLQLCPACGEDGTPNTLDHYLPKDSYPEFAISTFNLSPMCDTCQGWKLEHTLDANGARLFLHPYFDEFLDKQVLQLEIGRPYNSPASIHIGAHADLELDDKLLVSRHLKELHLETRYYHFFRDEYIRLLGCANDIRDAKLDMIQHFEIFCRNARRKSVNSWGHIFYESVLRNKELLIYLQTAILPKT